MTSHDFSARLHQFARYSRQTYNRGFYHGAGFTLAVIALVALYLHVGSQP